MTSQKAEFHSVIGKLTMTVLVGVPFVVGVFAMFNWLLNRSLKRQAAVPFGGVLEGIEVCRPNYTDTTRIGSRIDFTLRLWGGGSTKTKIKSAVAFVPDRNVVLYERTLQRQNPIQYNYVFQRGTEIPFDVCVYVDGVAPEEIEADFISVEVTDTEDNKFTIRKQEIER